MSDSLGATLHLELVAAVIYAIRAHAVELSELDRAIGDGDHGDNMERGIEALAECSFEPDSSPGEQLLVIGRLIMDRVGGASGALYGACLMTMGRTLCADSSENASNWLVAFEAGIDRIGQLGGAKPGQKTMLDVMVPAARAWRAVTGRDSSQIIKHVSDAASTGLEATRSMRATKGRAAYFAERSIGHLDPGAKSSELVIVAVAEWLMTQALRERHLA